MTTVPVEPNGCTRAFRGPSLGRGSKYPVHGAGGTHSVEAKELMALMRTPRRYTPPLHLSTSANLDLFRHAIPPLPPQRRRNECGKLTCLRDKI